MQATWPNLFIPGAAKAGTTSLHRYLRQHPEVFMSEEKEVHFFTKEWEQTRGDPEAFEKAKQAYQARFAPGTGLPVRGESTPAYLHDPEVPQRIAEHVPDARFVVSLRDPIERAHSDHTMLVRTNREDRSFLDVARQEASGKSDYHTKRGRYDEHLERYFDTFGRENVLVVLFEDFKRDTRGVLGEIASFLEIDAQAVDEIDYETVHNPGGQPRNRLASWLLTDERIHALARSLVPRPVRIWVGDHVLLQEGEKPPLEPEAARLMAGVFEDSIDRLETMLDRPLPELRLTWPDERA